jgi:hypothetical protein
LEVGSYTTDPVDNIIKTDILLIQYLSNITSTDQTFVIVPENLWSMMLAIPVILLLHNRRKKRKCKKAIELNKVV